MIPTIHSANTIDGSILPDTLPVSDATVLNSLLHSTVAMVALVDDDGQIVYVNQALEQLTGYSRDELLGRLIWTLRPKHFHDQARAGFHSDEAIRTGRRFETTWVGKDSEVHTLLCATQPAGRGQHAHPYRVITAIDVSALRNNEREARTLIRMLDQITEALIRVDKDQRISWCNRAAERLYGHSREELIGQSNTILMPPRLRGERNKFVKALYSSRPVRYGELIVCAATVPKSRCS